MPIFALIPLQPSAVFLSFSLIKVRGRDFRKLLDPL
jgi:hypothetical protein